MEHGFIKVAAVTPSGKVADTVYNRQQIISGMEEAFLKGAKIIVFPELCISGYTCEDLFFQEKLLSSCMEQLHLIVSHTKGRDALLFVGLPLEYGGKLYNVAAAICNGRLLAFIPKMNIPSYGEFYETRHFYPGKGLVGSISFDGETVPVGSDILFKAEGMEGLVVGCEICEDIWVPDSPGISHAMAGADVIVNLSASSETIGKDGYRRMLVEAASAKLICGYVYCSAGEGESTQDLVFGGHNIIAENGTVLGEARRFTNETIYGDIDIDRLRMERRRMNTFEVKENAPYLWIPFTLKREETVLERSFPALPFVPADTGERERRCEEILSIQSMGLKKRLAHTGCNSVVIGVSGGLDSTLALLVAARSMDLLGIERKQIRAVTMPCFGTTDRTYENACKLAKILGASLEEVRIGEAVKTHFRDIGQNPDDHDVVYENAQARERTQVLMDIANRENGLVVGTGDMSELALGWAT